jgi:perosamine synthetase
MINYGRQSIEQSDIDAVVDALKSEWLTQGPAIEAFEELVAEYVGAKHAVAFSNGTAALHGAAAASGLGPNDDVYTSPLTFIASANAARFVGAKPQLVDIEASTLNINLSEVPTNARAVIPVHFAGLPVNLQEANRPNRIIIEDAAHALGAMTPSGPVGNCAHSDMTCFSFHPVKPITTGEGGMVTTNDEGLADELRRFRSHGIVREPEQGGWYYQVNHLGYNYRMTDLQAALGLSQMKRLEHFMARRNEIAAKYREKLEGLPVVLPPAAPSGYRHGYHLFAIQVSNRRKVYDSLRSAGVGVQVHYVPVHHHPISKDIGLAKGDLPVCDAIYEGILSLPIHPSLSDADFDFVVETLIRVI